MPSKSSAQNTTFRCPLCPRKFTRAFNLKGHVRVHMDERPFVCGVCGRAFTRQHDRKTHEQLHNREMKWVCGGVLESGKSWGCGRRYDRKSNLSRHHRSKIGQDCIKPSSDGGVAEESADVEERLEMEVPVLSRPPPQPTNAKHSASVPSSQSNISQETALAPINDASLSVEWRHTAAVHKLVMWPSVKILLYPHEYNQGYLMRLERQRKPTYVNDLRDSALADDTMSFTSSLAHYGAGGGTKSKLNERSKVHAEATSMDPCVEIDHSGVFKLSEKTARRYYQTYLNRMHKLHPFLDEQELDLKVVSFIKCYSPRKSISATELNRCNANEQVTGALLDAPLSPGQYVDSNINNAIILLIFAIGAVSDSEFTIPSPTMNQRANCDCPRFSGPVRLATLGDGNQAVNEVFSPAPWRYACQISASICEPIDCRSKPFPFSARTSKFGENGSRRTAHICRGEFGNVRIESVVPGLALNRVATTMVGCFQGAPNLEYVHACLLAGLYDGQLADPLQSHMWINEAARACQLLVQRPVHEGLNDRTKELRNFAYWSCLQLESDLLAELDLPASGISRYENWVSLPSKEYPMNPDAIISPSAILMMYYYSQIHLQRMRDNMHTTPYEIKHQGHTSRLPSVQKAHIISLRVWRQCLPLPLQWKSTDDLAKEINSARLRASYYRTKYILHLPLLHYALHYGQPAWYGNDAQSSVDSRTGSTSSSQTISYRDYALLIHMLRATDSVTSNPTLSFPPEWTPPTFEWKKLPEWVWPICKTCVKCAIQGLTVFDGIEGRLVLPNIFGTAHEQFGYMLVLSATYNSSLSELVDRSTLDRLFKRTIRFLLHSENNSPTLRADIRILKEIYLKLFKCPLVPTGA